MSIKIIKVYILSVFYLQTSYLQKKNKNRVIVTLTRVLQSDNYEDKLVLQHTQNVYFFSVTQVLPKRTWIIQRFKRNTLSK